MAEVAGPTLLDRVHGPTASALRPGVSQVVAAMPSVLLHAPIGSSRVGPVEAEAEAERRGAPRRPEPDGRHPLGRRHADHGTHHGPTPAAAGVHDATDGG